MYRFQRTTLLTAMVLAGCVVAGAAGAQVIRITNVNSPAGHEIPLKANSSVQIDGVGNLLAECALNANSQCAALGSGGSSPNAPTNTLTRIDNDASLTAGETVRLAWTSNNAEACKVGSTGPASTGFTGVRATALAAGELATVGAEGTYSFTLVCYNAAGASTVSTVTASVAAATGGGGGGGGGANCNITSSDPSFNPSNFTKVNKNWASAFSSPDGSPQATYPEGISFPAPVGSSKSSYLVIPFVPNPSQLVNMYWDQVQARAIDGYPNARPAAGMFFAISPCIGDLRAPATVSNPDQFLRSGCRNFASSATLSWSTAPSRSQSTESVCKLNAGQTYYLHVMPANPEDGLVTGEHSCMDVTNSAQGCDVGVIFGGGPDF